MNTQTHMNTLARVLLLAPLVAGCTLPTTAPEAEPFSPPAVFAEWWEQINQQVCRAEPMERISWYRMEGAPRPQPGEALALWYPGTDRIYLSDPTDEYQVRHEMLHAILRTRSHDHPLFGWYRPGAYYFVDLPPPGSYC